MNRILYFYWHRVYYNSRMEDSVYKKHKIRRGAECKKLESYENQYIT